MIQPKIVVLLNVLKNIWHHLHITIIILNFEAFININSIYYEKRIYIITGSSDGYHRVCTITLSND